MVFSSHTFIYYFLPVTLVLYYASPRALRNLTLTVASYVFYAWTGPKFLALIAFTTCVDYVCGNFIYGHWRLFGPVSHDPRGTPRASELQRKLFLGLSLASNLSMLGFFKYFGFFEENANVLLQSLGRPLLNVVSIVLPAGISFYTFESISYSVDIYLGHARPASVSCVPLGARGWARIAGELRGLSSFACYIAQFPHLVAGPIIRYQDLESQILRREHSFAKFSRGVFFFSLGLSKKILLANPMGEVADAAFDTPGLGSVDAWYGVFAYALQIYFDFSGYSDMAIGLASMLGFEFPINFDSPYQASSITDFWRRWHISLSTWLKTYVYVPLGGNRRGSGRTYVNLITVMLVGGLWHGASWNFVIWGGIHGVWLCLERLYGKRSFYANLARPFRVLLTFLIVNVAWVFFRAPTLPVAVRYVSALATFWKAPDPRALLARAVLYSPQHVVVMVAALAVAFFGVTTWTLSRRVTFLRASYALVLLAWSLVAMTAQSHNPFLYFQF